MEDDRFTYVRTAIEFVEGLRVPTLLAHGNEKRASDAYIWARKHIQSKGYKVKVTRTGSDVYLEPA